MKKTRTTREILDQIENGFFRETDLTEASMPGGDEHRTFTHSQVERLLTDLGIKDNFWVSNKRLVEWLSTTEYEQIAMHMTYILKKHAIRVYEDSYYLPAQDELAELYSKKHHCLVGNPDNTEMPPRDYVSTILDALLQIERHWQRGRRLKLSSEVVILHDEIYGLIPRRFDKGVLKVAQTLYDYMNKEVYGRATNEVLERFAEKVRKVRAQYLAENWITDDSLEFGYLMAHVERCGQGIWREEDKVL